MRHYGNRLGAFRAAGLVGLMAGGLLLARAVPAQAPVRAPAGAQPAPAEAPRLLLAQAFPSGGGPGGGQGFGGAQQGGVAPRSGLFSLEPGATVQLTAFCTELLGDPPNAATRFVGGTAGKVMLADGSTGSLARAIQSRTVAIRGRANSFDPVRRVGSLVLDLYLVNTSPGPVRVVVPAGTQVTPAGQPAQPLPAGADRLFAAAEKKGLSYSNTLQFAVWAARGSSAEEVEQTQMVRLSRGDAAKVQALLDESGIDRAFDVNRGIASVRYDEAAERMAAAGQRVAGTAILGNGAQAAVEGVRGAEGKGVVKVSPRRGGEFYYAAQFTDRPEGRVSVRLSHLATGNPVRANGGKLLILKS